MDVLLDLDLDFFVWPICHEERVMPRLPDSECEYLATEKEVRDFLEQRCHLSQSSKVIGTDFIEHEEAFYTWRNWLRSGRLSNPFVVVHVDAHSDLGSGWNNPTLANLGRVLQLPANQRSELTRNSGLDSGNYLAFAIANRWIARLINVYPTESAPVPDTRRRSPQNVAPQHLHSLIQTFDISPLQCDGMAPRDIPAWCFRNNDYRTKVIQFHEIDLEPPVPLECLGAENFNFAGFTHMVVAESPQYTPQAAKGLLPAIRNYFERLPVV